MKLAGSKDGGHAKKEDSGFQITKKKIIISDLIFCPIKACLAEVSSLILSSVNLLNKMNSKQLKRENKCA